MKFLATLFVAFALVGICLGNEASLVAEPTKSHSDTPNHAEEVAHVSENHADSDADPKDGGAGVVSKISDDEDNFDDEDSEIYEGYAEGNDDDDDDDLDDTARFAYVRDEIDELEDSDDADTLMGTVRVADAEAEEHDPEVEKLTETAALRMAALEDVPQEVLDAEDEHDDEMFEIETVYRQMMDDIESDEGSPEEIKEIERSNDEEMEHIKATYRQLIEGGSDKPQDGDSEPLDAEHIDEMDDEGSEDEAKDETEDMVAPDSKTVPEVDAKIVQRVSVEGPEANVLDLKDEKLDRGFQMGSLNMMPTVGK